MRRFLLLIIPLLLLSCNNNNNSRAFYFWKTNGKIYPPEQRMLRMLELEYFYVRCFDVDWSFAYEDAVPKGVIELNGSISEQEAEIIPTIFIVNRVFKHIKDADLDYLAKRLLMKIPFRDGVKEIQIDCDWTASTKDKYFNFLKILKKRLSKEQILSVTVRLHQYRDRKLMGIPPVDRGMLMIYNVADPKKYETRNAILDPDIVDYYLRGKRYPISLDIALPLFEWGVWFRNQEFKGIVSNWHRELGQNKSLYEFLGNHFYKIKKDHVSYDNYFREGDVIRLDGAFEEDLEATIELINERVRLRNARITFFDWDKDKIKKYHEKNLFEYYNSLR